MCVGGDSPRPTFTPNLPVFLTVCSDCRGARSQDPIASFKTTEGFCSSSVPLTHASARAPPPPLENRILCICSHMQQKAGKLSWCSQMSKVALKAWVSGVPMWAEPSQSAQNLSSISDPFQYFGAITRTRVIYL